MPGYRATAEHLYPGEAPHAFLPWAWMAAADRRRHLTQPGRCADCHLDDTPLVPG
jgi:hypothetical protein